jgi:Cu-processing system permease protein
MAYLTLLLLLTLSILNLEDNPSKGLLSMLNIILIIVPLVSLIFSTIYMYNSSEFIELLLSQPVKRRSLILSIFSGLSISLVIAFVVGAGIPLLLLEGTSTAYAMLLAGIALTVSFVALAVLGSVITRDKAKGIGVAILMWLYFSVMFDGLVLLLMFQFSDYPLEKVMIAFCSLNPVDLARIIILLNMDISALMGYTGAVFSDFLGTGYGIAYAALIMLLWICIPVFIAVRKFSKKDL